MNFTKIQNKQPNEAFSDHFHQYSFEWIPGEARFLLDGVEIGRTTRFVPYRDVVIWPSNQIDVHSDISTSDMYLKQIDVTPLNESNSYGITSNKRPEPVASTVTRQHSVGNIRIENIRPLPATTQVQFDLSLSEQSADAQTTMIQLFDLMGHQQFSTSAPMLTTMPTTIELNQLSLESGTYVLRVSCGNTVASKQIIIRR